MIFPDFFAFLQSLKALRKGIEDSLRTSNSRSKGNEELVSISIIIVKGPKKLDSFEI